MQFTDEQQRFIDEHYQLLPLDADGVPIHVGDVMTFINGSSEEVRFMALNSAGWLVNDKGWWPCNLHHRTPTALDTLLELLNEYRDGGGTISEARLSEYAAKLRLEGDK